MFCKNCGTRLKEGADLCQHCGTAVRPASGGGQEQQKKKTALRASVIRPWVLPAAGVAVVFTVVFCVSRDRLAGSDPHEEDGMSGEEDRREADTRMEARQETARREADTQEEAVGQETEADGSSLGEVNRGDSAIFLRDIAWDDASDGGFDPTILHFTFSNDEVVDLEVMYPGMVENIEYRDITGDGTDEVLVYRYFANTATEYTLLDFIEVKDGRVKNISPEMDIAELADDVWNTTVEDFAVAGYESPILKMEAYGKEKEMAYPDRSYLVGYKDGSWQIIQ